MDFPLETVDKTNEFRQSAESFGRAFSKARAVEGAEPSSRSAEREISISALSFCKLFLCAHMVKEKATKGFVQFDIFCTFGLHSGGENLLDFPLCTVLERSILCLEIRSPR